MAAVLFNYKALDTKLIDTAQLAEIVSLDEDKEHTFSREIVEKWFQQAEETLPKLKEHLCVGALARWLAGSRAHEQTKVDDAGLTRRR